MTIRNKLFQIIHPEFIFEDERGCLTQLVHEGQRQVNVVTTRSGVFRGGHYHKENVETFYVAYGRFRFTAERDGKREEREFATGDMFQVYPYVLHGFEYLEDSMVVALYDKGVERTDGTLDSYTE